MRTALYDEHLALGAKMADFSGWEMPISYKGTVTEHMAVRQGVGIFDVSHMGRILISGPDAEAFVSFLSTNHIEGQSDFLAIYTVWASEQGGSIDDVLVYRQSSTEFFVIVNAGNRDKDLKHVLKAAKSFRVDVTTRYEEEGILAVQGPESERLVHDVLRGPWSLMPMRFLNTSYEGSSIILSRTGYTGSGGYEIITPNKVLVNLWRELLAKGQRYDVESIGLGARDTLRLEAGYALYGHELTDDIAPTESVSSWTVKWKKGHFIGQEALLRLQNNPKKRSQHGVALIDSGVPRSDCIVYKAGKAIGKVASGSHSPCLQQGIAIVMVEEGLAIGETIEIEVRQRRLKGQVVKLPFYKH